MNAGSLLQQETKAVWMAWLVISRACTGEQRCHRWTGTKCARACGRKWRHFFSVLFYCLLFETLVWSDTSKISNNSRITNELPQRHNFFGQCVYCKKLAQTVFFSKEYVVFFNNLLAKTGNHPRLDVGTSNCHALTKFLSTNTSYYWYNQKQF